MLSVLIPVFDEEKTLAHVVERVIALNLPTQIIIVDDCSTDGTPQVIRRLQEQHPAILSSRHERNRGKGASIRTGLSLVTGDTLIIQDADLEYHPEDYPAALRLIENGWADAVYGSRFLGPHRVFFYGHFLANKFLSFLVNLGTSTILSDMETGFKMFRTDTFRALEIQSSRFDFEVEVSVKLIRMGYRVYEIPITYTGRTYAEGKKITWKDGVHALFAIAKWVLIVPGKRKNAKRDA